MILNLGRIEIPKDEWKLFANRIEEIVYGQETFVKPPQHIEELAQHYGGILIEKQLKSVPVNEVMASNDIIDNNVEKARIEVNEDRGANWDTVDLNSISKSKSRTIGGEALGWYAFNKLQFPRMLSNLGFTTEQIHRSALLITGRLLHPASERETARWGRDTSALGELIGADFRHLSNNALYRTGDLLMQNRDEIERKLAGIEKSIFGLEEKIILYDLTNTYFEGISAGSEKAKRGRSKEKRSDCPLMTLALVLDEDGFPKASRTFAGNVSEPGTLKEILQELDTLRNDQLSLFENNPTVVIDAGIGTKENIELIKSKNYNYITVSRTRPDEIPEEGLQKIENKSGGNIFIKKLEQDGEVFIFCQSLQRMKKEESMKSRFMRRFEEGMKNIESSLHKLRGHKNYEDIMMRIGKLQGKTSRIARYYKIDVKKEDEKVVSIEWKIDEGKKVDLETRFAGSYYIRTDRTDISGEELWRLYTMLTHVEDAFRCLKSELGLRPNYHQKDRRMEGHIFISVLSYHLLALLQRELKEKGIRHRWPTIRERMSTQTRITTSITNKEGKRLHIRQTLTPEPQQMEIYRALGISGTPLRTKSTFL